MCVENHAQELKTINQMILFALVMICIGVNFQIFCFDFFF